jgi:hypothetical protein
VSFGRGNCACVVFVDIFDCLPWPPGKVSIIDCLYKCCFYGGEYCSLQVADYIFCVGAVLYVVEARHVRFVFIVVSPQVAFCARGAGLCKVALGRGLYIVVF